MTNRTVVWYFTFSGNYSYLSFQEGTTYRQLRDGIGASFLGPLNNGDGFDENQAAKTIPLVAGFAERVTPEDFHRRIGTYNTGNTRN